MVLAIGDVLDNRYRVEATPEQSEQRAFYLGRNLETGQPVAFWAISRSGEGLDVRSIIDLDALANTQHEALPSLQRLAFDDSLVYVCEYHGGPSLDEWQSRWPGRQVSARAAILALLPVLRALQQLQAAGTLFALHTIAPATIAVSAEGEVQLNFHALLPRRAEAEPRRSGAGRPEAAALQAHLRAVGATLYALLSGVAAPPAPRSHDALLAELSARGLSPSPALLAALVGLLSPEPNERFPSAEAAQNALRAALGPQLCPICGRDNLPTITYCEFCGALLPLARPASALSQALAPPAAPDPAGAAPLAASPGPPDHPAPPDPTPDRHPPGSPPRKLPTPAIVAAALVLLAACLGLGALAASRSTPPLVASASAVAGSPTTAAPLPESVAFQPSPDRAASPSATTAPATPSATTAPASPSAPAAPASPRATAAPASPAPHPPPREPPAGPGRRHAHTGAHLAPPDRRAALAGAHPRPHRHAHAARGAAPLSSGELQ